MAATSTFTPFCTTLSTGVLYTLNGAATGGAYCYHFNVPSESKTTAMLVNIAANNDMRLTVYRHEDDDSLSLVGQSNNAGNISEEVIAMTESGNYYWYMEALTADGSPFSFATVLNTSFDAYELNDTAALATALPDKFNTVIGNMDSATDIDYYNFTAIRGQDVRFNLTNEIGSNHDEWLLEYNNGSVWQQLNTGASANYQLEGIPVNYTLSVRARPNPIYTVNPSNTYKLTIGSTVRTSSNHSVEGEGSVLRVPLSATPSGYLTTQAYDNLTWSIRLADSTGHGLEGETVNFTYWLPSTDYVTDSVVTDSNGYASGIANLGGCFSNATSLEHYTYNNNVKTWWTTDYASGFWEINIPNGFASDELGVTYVTLGHICSHNYIRSE